MLGTSPVRLCFSPAYSRFCLPLHCRPPPLCGAIPASSDYVAKPGDKVAARVKTVDGDEQWILAEAVSYNHATNK